MFDVRVEKRSFSCGPGAYENPENGRLVKTYDLPNSLRNNMGLAVHRVRERYTVYVVAVNGRRVDSFLKKSNAAKLAKRLERAASQARLDADNAALLALYHATKLPKAA